LGRCILYFFDSLHLRWVVKRAYDGNTDIVIFDRYLFDQLTTLPLQNKFARAYAQFLFGLVPRPDLAFLLDADPEAAFRRKPEYPVEFLRQYRRSYAQVNDLLGGMVVIPPVPLEEAGRRIAMEAARAGIRVQEQSDAQPVSA
jgi:thymidylate kinase